MARKKSIADIAAQVERIRVNSILNYGGGNPDNVPRFQIDRLNAARRIGKKYRQNIQRATGISNQEAVMASVAGASNENMRMMDDRERMRSGLYRSPGSDVAVPRSVYMGVSPANKTAARSASSH